MRWPKWSIATSIEGDFLPILIGFVILFMSLPGFVMLLVNADRGSETIALPLLVLLGIGIILGAGFVVYGVRVCSYPGSLAYRITHGRFFTR
jgi:hypothetical protein